MLYYTVASMKCAVEEITSTIVLSAPSKYTSSIRTVDVENDVSLAVIVARVVGVKRTTTSFTKDITMWFMSTSVQIVVLAAGSLELAEIGGSCGTNPARHHVGEWKGWRRQDIVDGPYRSHSWAEWLAGPCG